MGCPYSLGDACFSLFTGSRKTVSKLTRELLGGKAIEFSLNLERWIYSNECEGGNVSN